METGEGTTVEETFFCAVKCLLQTHLRTQTLFFQNNFPVATKLLKELHKEVKTNRGWLPRWVHSFSRYNHKRSQAQHPVDQISAMLKSIPLMGKQGRELLYIILGITQLGMIVLLVIRVFVTLMMQIYI